MVFAKQICPVLLESLFKLPYQMPVKYKPCAFIEHFVYWHFFIEFSAKGAAGFSVCPNHTASDSKCTVDR